MKKLFFLFLALMATTCLLAEDFSVNGIYYNYLDGNNVEVTYRGDDAYSYDNEYSGAVTIPASVTYNGTTYRVTSIGHWAFAGCSSLTSVTIPNSVTSIGSSTFSGCSSLTSPVYNAHCFAYMPPSFEGAYTIPDGIKQIAGAAFYNCTSLTSITIPNSVTSIGYAAFEGCSSLTSVTIPNSVTSIEVSAFAGCSSLTSVTIPNSVTSIGDDAFDDCRSLASVTIGNSVTSIGNGAFENCSSLTSVTIPNSVTSIEWYAFSRCSSLTSITIPDGVTSLGDYAFHDCTSLTSVTIGNGVKSIGNGAFRGCSSLTSVTIPNSVTSIGSSTFDDCSSITSITIPNSVTSIEVSAFRGCSSLTSVTIPNSVTSIGSSAFYRCSSLTSITIPNSVTSIGNGAFENCSSLTSVTIPNSVTSIEWYAFSRCSSLTSITIPNSVTSIGDRAFWYCSALTSITIPNSVTSIGDEAFQYCSSLTSVTCEAITPPTIGKKAFYGVSSSIPVYVPCGCVEVYKAASDWSDFTNIQEPLAEYSIEVNVDDSIMGTAKVNYNTLCEGAQISATPNFGYHFVQWNDGNTDNPRTVQVTEDKNYTAYFDKNTYSIIKNCNSEQGYINGVSSAKHLGKVTFTAIANSDYQFTQWSDGVTDNPRTLVITQDTTLTAEFKLVRFQAGDLYYQICNADGLMSVVADTASWNIPTGALTVAQAREICAALESGTTTGTKYYVKGWVKRIHSKHAEAVSAYGNAEFYIEDVRGANSQSDILAFQVYGLEGKKINNPDAVAVGDFVVIYGELTNYNGTYETVGKGAAHIWKSTNPLLAESSGGEAGGTEDSGNTEGENSTTDSDIIIPENAIIFDADTDQGNAIVYVSGVPGQEYTVTKEGTTMTVSSGFLGTYNNEMHYRIYKNQTLTITSTRGNIKEIVFTCTANDDEQYGPGCFSFDSGEYVYSGANGQWKGDASEVVFTAAINQVRATQIAVVVEDRVSTTSANKVHYLKQTDDTDKYVVVTYQSWNSMNNYSDLTTVNIPSEVEYEGVTYKVIGIGYDAFARNYTISDMVIPKHIESIGDMAFYGASISSIYFEHSTPPIVSPTTFGGSYPIIYVPCGSIDAYQSAFNRLVEEYPAMYTVHLATFGKGHTDVLKNTLCEAQISATADFGYHFVQWSDGVTDNPRTLVLTQDTVLAAQFAQSFSGQCGNHLYWNYDQDSKTIAITGSGEMYDYTATTQPWYLFIEEIQKLTTSATTTTLGTSAFEGCIRLGEATLGVGIETLKANVFAGCNRLYHIYSFPTYTPFAEESSFANYNVYLHVPCESYEMYDLDVVFGHFKYIECLGSDKVDTDADSVKVEPSTNSVTITWPTDENADTYKIEIKRGDVVFCTLTFDKDGMLTNIAFAPSRSGSHPVTYAASTGNGLRFTVTSLDAATTYGYNVTTKDEEDNTLSTYSGEFTTKSNVTTDMDNIQSPVTTCQKVMRNGQLIILRDGKTYTTMGAEIQ